MTQKHSRFYGIAISPGIGWGKACIWGKAPITKRRKIRVGQVANQLARLSKAVEISKRQLTEIRNKVAQNIGNNEAKIFETYSLFLDDPVFLAQIEKKIVEKRINVENALADVIKESIEIYSAVEDLYLKERIQDIRDVGRRILDNLAGYNQQCILDGETEIIVVANELTPSQLIDFDEHNIKGFITERGGETSHSAILARSLGIPMISGIVNVLNKFEAGTPILVNGFNGKIIRNPKTEEVEIIQQQFPRLIISDDELKELFKQPTATKDGYKIHLLANIRTKSDVSYAKHFKAEGIGLYRTEISFLNRRTFPSEDQQFELYRTVVESTNPYAVTLRTLDLGGDKFSPYYPYHKSREMNPYLGLRAIRISLEEPEIFRNQLRAILRASAFGKVKLMLPMISGVEEIRQTKKILIKVMYELKQEKIKFDEELEIGAMIEIPSAVIAINHILKEVDFVSVGTNDLIQYTLAVDRSNELVSNYYEPLHPAIINSLKQIIDAANRAKKEASICGEMAADVRYTKILIGLGYRNLSMSSFFIPQVKKAVLSFDLDSARELAYKALNLWGIKKIKKLIAQDMNGDVDLNIPSK